MSISVGGCDWGQGNIIPKGTKSQYSVVHWSTVQFYTSSKVYTKSQCSAVKCSSTVHYTKVIHYIRVQCSTNKVQYRAVQCCGH